MVTRGLLLPLLLFLAPAARAASPWPPAAKARAQALVAQLTLTEKLSLMQGSNQGTYAGTLPAIPRLGIPELTLEDGPQGVGDGMGGVTAFPTALTVAQTWDLDLLAAFGAAVGLEHYIKGTNVALGPGTNLARNPFNGRLWEYYAESEVLSAAAVAAVVTGLQSNAGVSACVKHFLCNSQEFSRNSEDALVAPRPLHELYAHAYRAAAAAGAGSFMLGVNKVNHLENSANAQTLGILFDDGFEGFFVVRCRQAKRLLTPPFPPPLAPTPRRLRPTRLGPRLRADGLGGHHGAQCQRRRPGGHVCGDAAGLPVPVPQGLHQQWHAAGVGH